MSVCFQLWVERVFPALWQRVPEVGAEKLKALDPMVDQVTVIKGKSDRDQGQRLWLEIGLADMDLLQVELGVIHVAVELNAMFLKYPSHDSGR